MMTGSPVPESRRHGCRARRRGRRRTFRTRPSPGSRRAPGAEVVRAARQFQADGTCDDAGHRPLARHDHAAQPEASSPAS